MLRAGAKILVTVSAGSDQVTVARYEAGRPDQKKVIPARIADVIKTVTDFGATFPDVGQLLVQADQQKNLAGEKAHAETLKALRGHLDGWMKDQGDEGLKTERALPDPRPQKKDKK